MREFLLPTPGGEQVALSDYRNQRLVAVVFLGTECPIARRYVPVLNDLQARYADQGIQFLAIFSQPSDTVEKVAEHVGDFGLRIPALVDSHQRVADRFGAQRTPEAFVLDWQRTVRYQGRIDDRFGYRHARDDARRHDLAQALDELLARQEVSVVRTEVEGCLINRSPRAEAASVTYASHVAEILREHCQDCHRPGTAAPFSLLTPQDAVNWSAMIAEVVQSRQMPPWHADPRFGRFSNERRLTDEQIEILVSWDRHGAPLGDLERLPPPREFSEGWQIGTPDVVFKMPREFTVPASGAVRYQYFRTPTNFEEDVWIEAAEIRPGNRAVVHHIIVFYRDPDEPLGGGRFERKWVAATAPGAPPLVLLAPLGRRIPAGSELIWQVHYTPTGKVETDRSEIGLVFCKQPPRHNVLTAPVVNMRFRIPPDDPYHEVRAELTVRREATLLSLFPHMHLRGRDFEYRAIFPDGRHQVLLRVPYYDFNWQHGYQLEEPLKLPKGTRLQCVAHFDNSPDNPNNPDPTKTVTWGDQTWEEMMIGYVNFYWDDDRVGDEAEPPPSP